MVTTGAVLHGDRERLVGFDPVEHPVALQLGGSDPRELAAAARIAAELGYDEINLNCGCPSDRVRSGRFGACLMAEPSLVADGVAAMRAAVAVPVTVKCRIGIDDQDEDEALARFVDIVAAAGCTTFIVHARKAWLDGLSPKQNRDVPPLNYARVYRLKEARPDLAVIVNGGIASLDAAGDHLAHVDGVMLGRAAYQTPWLLAAVDSRLHGRADPVASREQAVAAMLPYIADCLARGVHLSRITRHMLGLYHGRPGGRLWRRILSERACRPGAGLEVIRDALAAVAGAADARRDAAA